LRPAPVIFSARGYRAPSAVADGAVSGIAAKRDLGSAESGTRRRAKTNRSRGQGEEGGTSLRRNIKVAIAGVGNCASALVQGVEYYRGREAAAQDGIMRPNIGGYRCGDIEFVAAFDVDRRKVGRPLEEAIFAKPNCTRVFQSALPVSNVIVQAGPILDGVPAHMADYPDDAAFRPVDLEPTDIAAALRGSGAEVLLCYLPVGSEQAVMHYAQACLDARIAMINCVPVFLASDRSWAERFRAAGVPIIGDDIKSQVGATIMHRTLVRLFSDRGVAIDHTYQLNTGGNTDFLNMLARNRLKWKKVSKTESVQSQLDERLDPRDIHVGPSDYVPWQRDNKVCFIRVEGRGFGGAPIELEMRLSVEDSPNSAGVVIDAIRCVKLALERGQAGPLVAPSAYYMKSPPRQLRDSIALDACNAFIDGREFALPTEAANGAKLAINPGA
jgi:myo-inositol-1-phosphate synthase